MNVRRLLVLLTVCWLAVPVHADGSSVPDFTLDVAAVPETTGLPVVITDEDFENKTPNLYAWDIFAWKTFAAMNWPAIEPTENNGYLRGFPDLNQTFADVQGGEEGPLVWETLKEKREMFLHGADTPEAARPNPWSSPYAYGLEGRAPMGDDSKRLFSTAKFTTLDETVEVRAEVFDAEDPGVYQSFGAQGLPVVARVFRGTPKLPAAKQELTDPGNAVRYEVKVNYDFYKYVVDNGLYFDPAAAARADQRPPIQLPWRTSLSNPGFNFLTQKPADLPYVQGYRADRTVAAFQAGAQAHSLPNGVQSNAPFPGDYRAPTPPRMGAIHLKAAWVPIEESEKSRFITRDAEYFVGKDKDPATATFGLIGLHIIQRIKVVAPQNKVNSQDFDGNSNFPGPAPGATGGTFIYSTWEHRDIRDGKDAYSPTTQYTYTNYFQIGPSTFVPAPPLSSPIDVQRVFPILEHTNDVNKKVWSELAGSVWTNYRLVGTQFTPVEAFRTQQEPATGGGQKTVSNPGILKDPINDIKIGDQDANAKYNNLGHQPAYLANMVIETNLGLQVFQGLPPSVKPVAQFPGAQGTTFNYDRNAPNVQFGAHGINTGGCMGCHAVAQLNGYSFSFVLLGGQAGASPDAELDGGFEAPLTKRRIGLLRANARVPLQSEAVQKFLGQTGTQTDLQATPDYFEIQPADGRISGSPMRFGDGVHIVQPTLPLQYLATVGGELQFVAEPAQPADAIWYLADPAHPTSTGDVLKREQLAFQSAASGEFLGAEGDAIALFPTLGPEFAPTQWNTDSLFASSSIQLQARTPVGTAPPFDFTIADNFTVHLVDNPTSNRALSFGDKVNLKTSTGYLQQTATPAQSPVDANGTTGKGLEAWILVDFLHAESNGPVQRLTDVAFQNASTGFLLTATLRNQILAEPPTPGQHGFTNEWNILPADP